MTSYIEWTLPAEWVRQETVWFSWPVSGHIWPGKQAAIEQKFVEIVAAASRFQLVSINAAAEAHERVAKMLTAAGVPESAYRLFPHATNDVWCRDHGPIFMRSRKTGAGRIADWLFNAWGGKFEPWDLDNKIPGLIAQSLGMAKESFPLILEGGAIESNGEGVLLTTPDVILNPNRGWNCDRKSAERILCDGLGMQEVVWVEHSLPNDDTDGHIDNVTRFVGPSAVVTVVDPELPGLQANFEALKLRFDSVIALPRPATDGPPKSHANFLILNGGVLLPVFGGKTDAEAVSILRDCFPGREIVPIDCNLLLEEGGAVHCLSMQQPA